MDTNGQDNLDKDGHNRPSQIASFPKPNSHKLMRRGPGVAIVIVCFDGGKELGHGFPKSYFSRQQACLFFSSERETRKPLWKR